MSSSSKEHQQYLKKQRKEKIIIIIFQLIIFVFFLALWEIAARLGLINTFLSSSPSLVVKTIGTLFVENDLLTHIGITIYETVIGFAISSILGLLVATLMWWNKRLAKIIDPYLTVLNSLPKVALGPLIIIWVGASINSIVFMSLLICVFVSIINIYNDFKQTDNSYLTLLKSFNASKKQLYFKVILPSNVKNIINNLKINISMTFIGVIMGELLVSKKGLGYLIMYGSQVFNINLVIASVFILGILAFLFYYLIRLIEKKVLVKN